MQFVQVGRVVVMLAVIAATASAVQQVDPNQLRQIRAKLNSKATSSQDRARILENLLVARQALIEERPQDEEVLFWRTAQAEDALLQGLSLNGLELVVRFGLPSTIQEANLNQFVRTALAQTSAIEEALPRAIESAPPGSERRARLEALRDSRLPMLRGITLTIAAERDLVEDPEAARGMGIQQLMVSAPTLRGEEELFTARQLALAKFGMGAHDEAREMLEILRRSDTGSPTEQLALRLALNEVSAQLDGYGQAAGRAQIAAATSGDSLERLLLVEQAARCWMILSREFLVDTENPDSQQHHEQAERNAVEAFLLLLPENGGLEFTNPQWIHLLIEERLGRLGVVDPMAAHIPDSVLIATAVPLVSSPETALQAREMLLPLLDKPGMIPRARSRFLAMLVRAEVVAEMHASASEHAITWSEISPNREAAHEGADLAVVQALLALQESPNDADMQALRKRAFDNLLDNFPDHNKIDQWRLEAAEVAKQSGQDVAAMSIYKSIGADSSYRPEAMSRLAVMMVRAVIESGNQADAIESARARLAELQQLLDESKRKFPKEVRRAQVGLDLSMAQLAILDGRAIEALDQLTRSGMDTLDPDLARQVCRARIEAAILTGRQGAVEAVIDELPFSVDVVVAQDTLLEILSVPGVPLPFDPLEDPVLQTAAHKLAGVIEAGAALNSANRMLIIEALRRSNQCEAALVNIDRLLEASPDLGDALFSKAECLRLDSDADQAETIRIYTRLSNGEPDSNPHRYWTAQLRLLQSMQADGRDPSKILARLNRLQRRYPHLGGPSYISEFALLRTELDGTSTP